MNLKKIIKFLTSSALIQGLNLVLSFLAIKFLSLSDLGRYNVAKSIAGTFDYANLGYRNGLDRKLPEDQNDDLNYLRFSIALFINTIVSGIILLCFTVYYEFNWFYILFGCAGAFLASFTLIRVFLRGTNRVDLFIKISFLGGIIPLIAQIIGLFFFGLIGLGVGFIVASMFNFFYYKKYVQITTFSELKKHTRYLKMFFKVGNIIYLTNFFAFIANNFDRFIIESMVGLEQVGEYGIIILVFSLSLIVPGAIYEMLFPDYIKDKRDLKKLKGHIKRHLKISVLFIGGFILLAYIGLPIVIPFVFDKYSYLVDAMQLILLALLPYIFINPIFAILFAFDKHQSILWANVLSSVIYLIGLVLVLKYDFSLDNLVYIKLAYTLINLILMGYFLFYHRKAIFIKKSWAA